MSVAVRAASEKAWLQDLATMLAQAQARFGDVSWQTETGEAIWAHKAIVYSRAAGSFQHRFLNAPPANSDPAASNLSLLYQHSRNSNSDNSTQLPATLHDSSSILPVTAPPTLSLSGTDPAFFQACLEFLYTGSQEMETVFTVLFDGFEDEGFVQNGRNGGGIERLRQDLIFCWRSKLFSDVQLIIGDESAPESTSFAAHRAILSSRSPYFHSLFLGGYGDSNHTRIHLPSPPFTPASTTFCLGWIYSGTLDYGIRTFDLTTGLDIWRCAAYLGLSLLQEEVAFKIEGMLNLKRAARVYAFALKPDVCDSRLQQSAAEFVVGQFADVWACSTIGNLEFDQQKYLVQAVCSMITPTTLVTISRSTFALRKKVELEKSSWGSHIHSMTEGIEERLVVALASSLPEVVKSEGFVNLIDGVGWSTDVVEWILELVLKGLSEKNAAVVYQELVGSVLLREGGILMDTRILVEEAKNGVLKFIRLRWMSIRSARGFDKLETWSLKEISDEIEIPIEDLQATSPKPLTTRIDLRISPRKLATSDARPNLATRAAARLGNSRTVETTPTRGGRLPRTTETRGGIGGGSARGRATTVGSSRIGGTIISSSSPSPAAPPLRTTTSSTSRPPVASSVASTSTNTLEKPNTTRRPSLANSVRSATSLSTNRSTPLATRTAITPRTPASSSTVRPVTSLANSTAFPTSTTSSPSVAPAARTTRTMRISGPPAPSTTIGGATPTKRSNSSASNTGSIDAVARRRPASAAATHSTSTLSTEIPPPLPLPPASTTKTRSLISSRPPFSASATTTATKRPVSIKSTVSTRPSARASAVPTTLATTSKIRTPVKSAPALPSPSPPTASNPGTSTRPAAGPATSPTTTKLPGLKLLAGIPCIVTALATPPTTTPSSPTASSSSYSHPSASSPPGQTKSIRFKAIVRYIGSVLFAPGEWVGIEVQSSLLPEGGLEGEIGANDGSIDGVRYFDLLGAGVDPRSRSATPLLSPSLAASATFQDQSQGGRGAGEDGLLSAPMRRGRRSLSADGARTSGGGSSRSSLGSEGGGTIGAFVRPNQVVYVL